MKVSITSFAHCLKQKINEMNTVLVKVTVKEKAKEKAKETAKELKNKS